MIGIVRKNAKNIAGQRFGRLVAIEPVGHDKSGGLLWKCVCDCGNIKTVSGIELRRGRIRSCGCLAKHTSSLPKKHGDCSRDYNKRPRLYKIWQGMKARCYDPKNNKNYLYYGAKGIYVCDEWKNDYSAFKKWALENGYKDDLTIDRIDNNGPYAPWNCRWVTKSYNSSHRQNTISAVTAWDVWFEYIHTNKTIKQLAEEYEVSRWTVMRIVNGEGRYKDIITLAQEELHYGDSI